MKIQQLRLENFKAFRKAEINFRPLTILAGANSSGKTSVLNAITSILQTPPNLFPFKYLPNGKICQLGGYKDIVFGHNTRDSFKIGITAVRQKTTHSFDSSYRYSSAGNQILLEAMRYSDGDDGFDIRWRGEKTGYWTTLTVPSFNKLRSGKGSPPGISEVLVGLDKLVKNLERKTTSKQRQSGLRSPLNFLKNQSKTPYNLKKRAGVELREEFRFSRAAASSVLTSFEGLLNRLGTETTYIGPVRAYPSRFYQAELADQGIDKLGKNSAAILFEWKKYQRQRFEDVLGLLKLLELASRVDTTSGLEDVIRLNVQPFQHKEIVNLADSGFGLSQILPILVADAALENAGTMLVNQPEVHLHPSSQAQLANYFASRLSSRNYIIETHSEYLINRLRLLVVEGTLSADDVHIVYVDTPKKSANGSTIHEVTLGAGGELNGAPKGFFETYFNDTFRIAMSAASKS
jgi:predicted ATPase